MNAGWTEDRADGERRGTVEEEIVSKCECECVKRQWRITLEG